MKIIKLLMPLIIIFPSITSCNKRESGEVILMAGQSNMEGFDAPFSALSDDKIAYYSSNHDNVKISYDCTFDYTLGIATKPNSSDNEFVNVEFGQGRNKELFGSEVGLAKYLGLHNPNKKYYLIKSCEGATYLRKEWAADGRCYKTFASDVKKSLETLKRKNVDAKIVGMIWMQGEADAQYDDITQKEYFNNTKALIDRVTTTFSDYIDTNTFKWIDSGITTDGIWPKAEMINNAKKELVATNSNYRYVSVSETLPKINIHHYNQDSYLKLGEAYGECYLH